MNIIVNKTELVKLIHVYECKKFYGGKLYVKF